MGEKEKFDFEIAPTGGFTENEAMDAKTFWSDVNFEYYKKKRQWSEFMAGKIETFKPSSVLEFGCNAGKNIAVLNDKLPDVFNAGIDINEPAVTWGREQGLSLAVGDERSLEILPDNAFDVIFTVSVLDHLPYPQKAFQSMARVARKAVLLLEPWLGEEGRVVRNTNIKTGEVIDTTPYSYSWDYQKIGDEFAPDWRLDIESYRIPSNLGRFYQLYQFIAPKG